MTAPADIRRVGMLTPSSNTVLEPYTQRMFAAFGEAASVHFARFRVVEISMSAGSVGQFDQAPILDAAARLAEARVHCIAWNGTSAAWLGLDKDRELARAITAATGIPAATAMLAFDEALQALGARRIGLVTPYLSEVQERIVANYAARGFEVVAEERLEDPGNFSFALHTPAAIADQCRRVAKAKPDAILIVCTNFRGAPIAAAIEAETGVPVLDSVAVTAWKAMAVAGLDPARVTGWGGAFRLPATASLTELEPEEHGGSTS